MPESEPRQATGRSLPPVAEDILADRIARGESQPLETIQTAKTSRRKVNPPPLRGARRRGNPVNAGACDSGLLRSARNDGHRIRVPLFP